jgi:hypothetical protein
MIARDLSKRCTTSFGSST